MTAPDHADQADGRYWAKRERSAAFSDPVDCPPSAEMAP